MGYVELRSFAAKNPQTVETTVKTAALARALRVEIGRLVHGPCYQSERAVKRIRDQRAGRYREYNERESSR